MDNRNGYILSLMICFLAINLYSCKKFLDAKPNSNLTTPTTLSDVSKLLDNVNDLNLNNGVSSGEASSDNYFYPDDIYDSFPSFFRNVYIWGPVIISSDPSTISEWGNTYKNIYTTNLAINTLNKIGRTASNGQEYDRIKGSSLFFRGHFFWSLVDVYAKAYNPNTAGVDFGIPLKLNVEINEKVTRANVANSYQQIISDFKEAAKLLPVTSNYVERPTKPAAYGTLSRVYLNMGDFVNARKYADSCLILKNALIDYNTLDKNSDAPFTNNLTELTIYINGGLDNTPANGGLVDTTLFNSYEDNDLRKQLFFASLGNGHYYFKGAYSPIGYYFTCAGSSIDEVYLIRAECAARAGDLDLALKDLNKLMKTRYLQGTFVPYTSSDKKAVLQMILAERRKELIFRDLRWGDIKRLNLEGANINLVRKIHSQFYRLPPNDNRFALPIPQSVVDISGIPQNPR